MTPRVLLEPEAEAEYLEAQNWYASRSSRVAEAFRASVRTVLEAIENSPARFPTALADIRKAKVPHFPYVVYFVALAEVTSVIAIIHGRRDPTVAGAALMPKKGLLNPRALLITSAVAELPTGAALMVAPALVLDLLLGKELAAPAAPLVARVAGAALVAIGAICWLARESSTGSAQPAVIVGLLIYNPAVAMILVHATLLGGARGVALWPAVLVHMALALWCVGCLRSRGASMR